ncbi:hypothetical protein M407DRAFT_25156 [Tulasnella calospora MUT 4182]|uniref:Uncharacterized protein n=1 Tax=Tulasnella calospora MUT 4182 TaxID=1051891 RepID=A0A0C3QI39_9AGAM|nr:hypothetical protein M407DRAFT_25156 [Tulasnella calospora MUT 4182]
MFRPGGPPNLVAQTTGQNGGIETSYSVGLNTLSQQGYGADAPRQHLTPSATLPPKPQSTVIAGTNALGAARSTLPFSLWPLESRGDTTNSFLFNRPNVEAQSPVLPNGSTVSSQRPPVAPYPRFPSRKLVAIQPGTAPVDLEGFRPRLKDGLSSRVRHEHQEPPLDRQTVPEGATDRARLYIGGLLKKAAEKKKEAESKRPGDVTRVD